MIVFWLVAAVISAVAAGLVLTSARRAERRAVDAESPGVIAHRRHLSELDDLVARGLLSPEEFDSARAEAGRRLLAAADETQAPVMSGGRRLATAGAALAPLLAFGLYLWVGSPGVADQPMSKRIAAWRVTDPASLSAEQIAVVLTEVSKTRPGDAKLLKMLASARQASGDPFGAVKALRAAVKIAPNDPELWTAMGEGFVGVSQGQIGSDARQAFNEALKLDPRAAVPRYELALGDIQDGKLAEGLAGWKALLAELPADDPRRAGLATEIAQVEKTGKPPGDQPDPAATASAGADMSQAIQGMVAGLAARLEASPDDAEGWARLIRAYSVLGETAKRDAALAKAREQFKSQPEVLRKLQSASEKPQ